MHIFRKAVKLMFGHIAKNPFKKKSGHQNPLFKYYLRKLDFEWLLSKNHPPKPPGKLYPQNPLPLASMSAC